MKLPELMRADTSGGEIAYVDAGEGAPVVLIHGFPTSSYLWREYVPLFAGRFRVIAPDLIGYGASEKRSDTPLDLRSQARYVGELLAHVGVDDEVALVGHDIGGGIAQLLAFQRDPGRTALVLIDSVSFDSWPIEAVRMIQATGEDEATPEFADGIVRVALDTGIARKERLTEELAAAFTAPFTADGGPQALVRAARGIDGEGLAGTEAALAALADRVFVLWGEDDPYQEVSWAHRISDTAPGSTVALLPGCSHFLTEDAPTTIGPLIYEWLRVRYLGEQHRHEGEGSLDPRSAPSFERPEPLDPVE